MIRVFSGQYSKFPDDLDTFVDQDAAFWLFFPLGAAARRKIVEKVGYASIPERALKPPLFRSAILQMPMWITDYSTGRKWSPPVITPNMYDYQINSLWNDTLLIERIESGWKPSDYPPPWKSYHHPTW